MTVDAELRVRIGGVFDPDVGTTSATGVPSSPGSSSTPGWAIASTASPVGPYDELLWLTWAAGPAGVRPQVRAIWVSTRASAADGQRNWGLPKRLAHFGWTGDPRRGTVRVTSERGKAEQ